MIVLAATFLYVGIAMGLAVFLLDSDKKANNNPDVAASLMVGAVWPFLIIAIPVVLLLQRLDEAGKSLPSNARFKQHLPERLTPMTAKSMNRLNPDETMATNYRISITAKLEAVAAEMFEASKKGFVIQFNIAAPVDGKPGAVTINITKAYT